MSYSKERDYFYIGMAVIAVPLCIFLIGYRLGEVSGRAEQAINSEIQTLIKCMNGDVMHTTEFADIRCVGIPKTTESKMQTKHEI